MSGPVLEAADDVACPACQGSVVAGERYCEQCGAEVGEPEPAAPGAPGAPAVPVVAPRACAACGGVVAADGYCEQCGVPAPRERDHFGEQPASWVAGVCDRGIRHRRNEDALATAADPEPGSRAVLVVCDGVSSSVDSDVASLAAARAAREVLVTSRAQGMGTPSALVSAVTARLGAAADAATLAVAGATIDHEGHNPPSCTFVAGVVEAGLLVVGSVGDSRAYWVPDAGAARVLTVDDSWAAEQIALGMPQAQAETARGAHAITRWLGVDAPDHTPRTASMALDAPGWVVLCSDGLWNYCSPAAELGALVRATSAAQGHAPSALAGALVDWANAQGGQDNITVALARIGPVPDAAGTPD